MRFTRSQHSSEDTASVSDIAIQRIRKYPYSRIAHPAGMDFCRIAHHYQLPWILHRQHLEHDCIFQAEDGGVRANAKRQRQHGDGGKGRILAQHAQRVSEVLKKSSHGITGYISVTLM